MKSPKLYRLEKCIQKSVLNFLLRKYNCLYEQLEYLYNLYGHISMDLSKKDWRIVFSNTK